MPAYQAGRDRPAAGRGRAGQRNRAGLRRQPVKPAPTPRQLPRTILLQRHHEGSVARHLPTKDEFAREYSKLPARINLIVDQAQQQGSLQVALSGLNSIRHTLDSLSRLAGFDRQGAQVNVAVQTNVHLDLRQISRRLIEHFDREPELKARIAQALLEIDDEHAA